jgi:hypothetical protein
MAWRGRGNDFINVMRSAEGVDWSAKIRLDESTTRSPVLGTLGDVLVLSWIGVKDRKVNIARSRDGIDF